MSQNMNVPNAGGPAGGQGRPGQMTAVMRAMAQATGPKVLRIGLVTGGRILEERVIKQRTTVTVGPSEKAMFVVQAPGLPAQFKLFELIGPDYYLNFLDGMTGRVALATGITDIVALRGQAKKVGNVYQVKLTEEARGKVIVGETTFLFQFVAPPPPQPRPQLPLAVKGGLASQIDWNLTVIAAFSFMLHFGLVGAMYSDWMDPVVNEDLGIAQLLQIEKNLPPPVVEDKPVESDKGKDEKKPEKAAEAKPAGGAPKPGGGPAPKVSEAQAAKLASAVEALSMQLLGTKGASGPAVAGVLNNASDIPTADLSNAARSGAGVSTAGDLRGIGGAGGPVRPGQAGNGLAGISGGTGQQGTSSSGQMTATQGPKGDVRVEPIASGGSVSGAEQCIAKLRPRFKTCYNRGLSSDPTMSGKVVVQAKVGPNGEVTGTEVVSNQGLSSDVVECIRAAIKRADCMSAGPSGGSVGIPVSFVQQK